MDFLKNLKLCFLPLEKSVYITWCVCLSTAFIILNYANQFRKRSIVESKLTADQKTHLSRVALSSLHALKMFQTDCYQEECENYKSCMREESKEYENRKSNNASSYTEKLLSQRESVSQHKGQVGKSAQGLTI
ncbi:hypothetical protein OTUT144_0218 [Orientia tsutsugamushi str. UT144]|uniref:Uncharacterized protein n=1 Tax=Orientia tsutsugamushi str. UT144 TaxID=1441384 RepID=A0A0F3RN17_ORITS|nr:hypothetical protein [Orientia tsutsugamushi]KJW07725.1 hypothetical protein OTUT144_0218 [Orientia tsutsugamushi str. UT144]